MAYKPQPQRSASELLIAEAREHGTLQAADDSALRTLPPRTRAVSAGEDIVHQGEKPDMAVLVLAGTLARYHMLPDGSRQYLSFHIRGDLPDVQSVFLTVMDHSLCALNDGAIAAFPHGPVCDLMLKRPNVSV